MGLHFIPLSALTCQIRIVVLRGACNSHTGVRFVDLAFLMEVLRMGVIKSPEDKRSARFTLVMTHETKRDFFAYCKSCGFTPSEVMRDFIAGRIKKFKERS